MDHADVISRIDTYRESLRKSIKNNYQVLYNHISCFLGVKNVKDDNNVNIGFRFQINIKNEDISIIVANNGSIRYKKKGDSDYHRLEGKKYSDEFICRSLSQILYNIKNYQKTHKQFYPIEDAIIMDNRMRDMTMLNDISGGSPIITGAINREDELQLNKAKEEYGKLLQKLDSDHASRLHNYIKLEIENFDVEGINFLLLQKGMEPLSRPGAVAAAVVEEIVPINPLQRRGVPEARRQNNAGRSSLPPINAGSQGQNPQDHGVDDRPPSYTSLYGPPRDPQRPSGSVALPQLPSARGPSDNVPHGR